MKAAEGFAFVRQEKPSNCSAVALANAMRWIGACGCAFGNDPLGGSPYGVRIGSETTTWAPATGYTSPTYR